MLKDEYCVSQNDDQLVKCSITQMMQCDVSGEDDQISHCDQNYARNEDIALANTIADNDLTTHLASSGIAGIAAAAAISSARRRNKSYNFETIPAVRKRQSTRLIRKLQNLIEEYTVRVGQQAVILICNPRVAHKSSSQLDSPTASTHFKVYGSSPLENVVRTLRPILVQELDGALRNFQILHEQALNSTGGTASIWNNRGPETLPPLMVDGIPTPLDKMTQAQLRAFIPVMLKYSTGRGKPGWGRPHARPTWWPEDVPWANVRSDVRTQDEKASVSWTAALKKVVRCCYEYHGRADLLADYSHHDNTGNDGITATQLMDIDPQAASTHRSYMLSARNADSQDPNQPNVYTLNMVHMPTSEAMQGAGNVATDMLNQVGRYQQYHLMPSYGIKTEKDGGYSYIRLDDNGKPPEVASMEAAATIEEYNVENVKFPSNEDLALQSFSTGGDMVSLPADSIMQLHSNDATTAILHMIGSSNHKGNQ